MDIFEESYLLMQGDLDCPADCVLCEDGPMQFLPGEIEHMEKKLGIPKEKLANMHEIGGHAVWMIARDEGHCIFYDCGRCRNRDARPLDCRTYPAIPSKKDGRISVRLDSRCPLVKKGMISDEFLSRAESAWKKAAPPQWWLKIYEKMI